MDGAGTPRGLAPPDVARGPRWKGPAAVLVAGALALLAATVWAIRRPTPAALFGIMWFWLTFAPTVQWVALPSAPLADRQAYIMGIGLACVVVQVGVALYDLTPGRCTAALATVCVTAAACCLGVRTVQRNSDSTWTCGAARRVVTRPPGKGPRHPCGSEHTGVAASGRAHAVNPPPSGAPGVAAGRHARWPTHSLSPDTTVHGVDVCC